MAGPIHMLKVDAADPPEPALRTMGPTVVAVDAQVFKDERRLEQEREGCLRIICSDVCSLFLA